ncbi:MAG TPA: hypothetical protein VFS00_11370, partial [Polyangiaceae bacterium]|nr:hypothetical protein [Polyangiaceae bacterium]
EAPGAWAFRRLGLPPDAGAAAVDRAVAAARQQAGAGEERAELRALGKMLRDPFYARAFLALGSRAEVERAGWFDDGGPAAGDDDDPRREADWPVTPLDKLLRALASEDGPNGAGDPGGAGTAAAGDPGGRAGLPADASAPAPLAVLVTTGSFCPVHRGHLAMMERAREALAARGRRVLAGWLSVSHDEYVLAKCGPDAPPATHRLALCEAAVRESDWLMVDPWEALHCRRALNFTDVLARLEGLLARQVKTFRPIEVWYAFGGDNARFALSFVGRGRGVCVPRPGAEAREREAREHPLVRDNPRVVFAPPIDDRAAAEASSTGARAGRLEAVPGGVRRHLDAWRQGPRGGARLFVRDEGAWPVEPWLPGRDAGAVAAALARF